MPPRRVPNIELAARLDTSDAWIRDRLGIAARHVAAGVSTVDLATEAGGRALEMAGYGALDAVVLATSTPDRLCPASAPEVAARLGYTGIAAFDVNAVCAGFVHALATGNALIRGHMADRVLVIGADVFTTLVDPDDRLTASIFGDGAGAVVLRAGSPDEAGALRSFDLGSDGTQVATVEVPGGGARDRLGLPVANRRPYLVMDGPAVFQRAVREMTGSSRRVLARAGWGAAAVDRFVPHQANIRIIRAVAEELGIAGDRVTANIEHVGNTVAASIPLALADAHDGGLLGAGQRVLVTSIGAGLAWGSAVFTWPELDGKARLR
ncbi:ketoacyl-ACP synthase III [Catenulispora subtropica]|uniref:Ketoacyl-ACP synthase III n=1 Tax=Catenulispora subtropica TaxID=450798 RepID=A0ABP5BQQ9_9ACTN